MKSNFLLLIRLGLLILVLFGVAYTATQVLFFTTICLVLVVCVLMIEFYYSIKRRFLFYEKTLQAILNEDFSADYSKIKGFDNYKDLLLVYEKLKSNKQELNSKDIIYNSILNSVDTGVLILKKENEEWIIQLLNDHFSKKIGLPKVSKWSYLKKQAPSLCALIENENFKDFKNTIRIRLKKQPVQEFVVQLSTTKVYEQEFAIVLLESVQNLVEKKKKEAWVNLMNIISHELLNSLTPIQSLSQNLYEIFESDTVIDKELYQDVKQSTYTMVKRSNHLQQFVESYRKLTVLPSPKKEFIEVNNLIENCLLVMKTVLEQERIRVTLNIENDCKIAIDEKQIEQVLINLITNSMHALKEVTDKKIMVVAKQQVNRFVIEVLDNGDGVDNEIEHKIFLPFFTTRQGGGGVGLTLSKSIMEAHNGYLLYSRKNTNTCFSLVFTLK